MTQFSNSLKIIPMGIRENYDVVLEKIVATANRANRDPSSIKLVAVSKTHAIDVLREAIDSGINVLGENKVQEAAEKVDALGCDSAEWHLIGHLQKNKARKAVQTFDVIQTLDSVELARRLNRICEEESRANLSVLIQVDLGGESTKSGATEAEIPALIECLNECKHLILGGLMTVPPFYADVEKVRPLFRHLREIRDKLSEQDAFQGRLGELSMGMSHDFEVAIEEGATIVRVGTAIFGNRFST